MLDVYLCQIINITDQKISSTFQLFGCVINKEAAIVANKLITKVTENAWVVSLITVEAS